MHTQTDTQAQAQAQPSGWEVMQMNPRTRGFTTCWDMGTPLEGEGMSSIWN